MRTKTKEKALSLKNKERAWQKLANSRKDKGDSVAGVTTRPMVSGQAEGLFTAQNTNSYLVYRLQLTCLFSHTYIHLKYATPIPNKRIQLQVLNLPKLSGFSGSQRAKPELS